MGLYINPVSDVQKIGRQLLDGFDAWVSSPTFAELTAELKPGEVLVGVYDRILFQLAPMIPDAKELEAFDSQVRDGSLISLGYYAVPEQEFRVRCC